MPSIDAADNNWAEICPFPDQADAGKGKVRIWSLVLESRGVPHRRRLVGTRVALFAPTPELGRAAEEIRSYERENRLWPPQRTQAPAAPGSRWRTFGVLVALGLFHDLTFQPPGRVLGIAVDWHRAGTMQASRVLRGEWWRSVTALTLHADGLHLAGNMLLGGLLLVQLGRQLGVGLSTLLVLVAGTLGNLTNAAVREAGHRSIGASTAVFGALGILVARSAWATPRRDWRRWVVPLGAGAGLIAFTGVGGERTDYLAHLFGFAWGLVVGALTQWPFPVQRPGRWKALACGVGAAALVAGAWALALGYG
ncbi:MAG: rhomboid family intramembrane serine protease [Deferrisomatales bacterium]|nr:rhomboid family intramembrane serine protease [Deferrisomatales bacterium]